VKALLVRLEPIIWGLFGGGMMVAALLYPAYLLVFGVAGPMGVLSESALSYERMAALTGNPIGKLVLIAMIALPLWAGAHHVRHIFLDFGGLARDGLVGSLCYAVALVGSVVAILAVLAI